MRLLDLAVEDGQSNMAVDEAILESMVRGHAPPTLRLYSWQSIYLTIGSAEPVADVDLDACLAARAGLVRRHSGGTAVLHQRQVAYTVVLPERHPLVTGALLESYRRVSPALLTAMSLLGAPARAVEPAEVNSRRQQADKRWNAACLASLVAYEILNGDRKIVAHAQIRRRGAVLQHGVILLDFDPSLMANLLTTRSDGEQQELRSYLRERVGSLAEITGREIGLEEVARAVRMGFTRALGIELQHGELSAEERELAEGLKATKYGTATWNFRR